MFLIQPASGMSIWFENWWVLWVLVLKLGVLWVLKIQQTEAQSIELRLSSPEFLFNDIQIFLFLKSHHYWKVFSSQNILPYIIGYDKLLIFHEDPQPPYQNLGVVTPKSTPGLMSTTSIEFDTRTKKQLLRLHWNKISSCTYTCNHSASFSCMS